MVGWQGKVARVAVAALVAGAIVLAAVAAPILLAPQPSVSELPEHPEYDPANVVPDRLDDTGSVATEVDGEGTLVLIDRSHGNRVARGDLVALRRAVVNAGGTVGYVESGDDFNASLRRADAFVVLDPSSDYSGEERDALDAFLRDGGRLLVAAEPDRKSLQSSGFGVALVDVRSQVGKLAGHYGFTFGTEYLYNVRADGKDGIFKNIVAQPADGATGALVGGVERTALYTATSVDSAGGTTLLETAPGAKRSSVGGDGQYPVAAVNAEGNVLAVGDTTFLEVGNHNVADNEVFVSHLVEFLLRGDTTGTLPEPEPTTGIGSGSEGGTGGL